MAESNPLHSSRSDYVPPLGKESTSVFRTFLAFILSAATLTAVGCGSSGTLGDGGSGGGGGGTQAAGPTLSGLAPASAVVGTSQLSLVAYGSNLGEDPTIEWNGTALATSCVDINLTPASCASAAALSATVPASDLAATGTAKVTVSSSGTGGGTSNALNFTIAQPPSGNTFVRAVAGISDANDLAWDAARGKLYVSVSATDPAKPNTIAVIDPVAGSATSFVSAGSNPNLLSISSDGGYLWAGMDGSSTVQRLVLPGLSQDISFPLPLDSGNNPQQAVALQAAPVSAHTLAVIAGHPGYSPAGDGVYVYDDATARTSHVPGFGAQGGPMIDWMQWGADDTAIYGNQYTTIDAGGIARMTVNASGVSLASYGGGLLLQPTITQYDRSNRLLYSYGGVYDPAKLSLAGIFDLPETGAEACTADSVLNRYYCLTTNSIGGTDVSSFELWVFDLNSYALINRVYYGTTAGSSLSPITGGPVKLVRWGNAGLALLTATELYLGNGGVFLIDGAAVNPSGVPDSTNGVANGSYAWLNTMTPDVATSTSGEVQVTIHGYGFSPDSTACWNCSFLQFRFLPTTYVSPTQLNVTIPLASVSSTEPLEVSVFDQGASLFSSNALTFTVLPSSGTTQVTPLNLCGLAMAWDAGSGSLYVATADYDGAYPNSIVAVNPASGTVVKSQAVGADPAFVSDSANGQYLYVAFDSSTNLTQLALPGLDAVTTPLKTPDGETWLPGDLKAAPQDPNTVAATLIMPGWEPEALGGVVVFNNGIPLPNALPGWTGGQTVPALYDTLAWSASDQLLTSAASGWDTGESGPLYQLQVNQSGVSYEGQGGAVFDTAGGYTHSDFGTNLIYSDGGSVADPTTGSIVGSYGASGLVAPDSSLNRVFILGQTAAQTNTDNYTIESFDQKAFTPISSITLSNVSGSPIALARWGNSGLAVLSAGGLADVFENGNGMLYLLEDKSFVSNNKPTLQQAEQERVQQRWKRMTIRQTLARVHKAEHDRITAAQ